MKPIKMLFILLIGMISFTAMASTSSLEQKQKQITIPVKEYKVIINVETKIYCQSIPSEQITPIDISYQSNCLNNQNLTIKQYNKDVGWNISNTYLNDNYNYSKDMHYLHRYCNSKNKLSIPIVK